MSKVLHIAFSIHSSSAPFLLHNELRKTLQVDSRILTLFSTVDDVYTYSLLPSWFSFLLPVFYRVNGFVNSFLLLPKRYSLWSLNLLSSFPSIFFFIGILLLKPSTIHIHWIGSSTVDLRMLKLFKHAKIIVTLHDYWFFTAGCHSPVRCNSLASECTTCPFTLGPLSQRVLTSLRNSKIRFLLENVFVIILPSSSLYTFSQKYISEHKLLSSKYRIIPNITPIRCSPGPKLHHQTYQVANSVNTRILRIGFYTHSLKDYNKNFAECYRSVRNFINQYKNISVQIVVIGEGKSSLRIPLYLDNMPLNLTVLRLGYLNQSDLDLLFFASIDIFMCVSYFETFSQLSFECLNRGIPVITYSDIGPSDFVIDSRTGFSVDRTLNDGLTRALHLFHQSSSLMDRTLVREVHFANLTPSSLALDYYSKFLFPSNL